MLTSATIYHTHYSTVLKSRRKLNNLRNTKKIFRLHHFNDLTCSIDPEILLVFRKEGAIS